MSIFVLRVVPQIEIRFHKKNKKKRSAPSTRACKCKQSGGGWGWVGGLGPGVPWRRLSTASVAVLSWDACVQQRRSAVWSIRARSRPSQVPPAMTVRV